MDATTYFTSQQVARLTARCLVAQFPAELNNRVIRWFDYLWLSKKSLNEEKTLNLLPDKLKAEIALHVHLDTLKRVEIFQNTEAGFLCELVLRLKPAMTAHGYFKVLRSQGNIAAEWTKALTLVSTTHRRIKQVVTDNGRTTLALLKAGSYFGEISILNMGSAGNRRTASVRSIGYSDLFCLSKEALWEVLKDYPTARVRLESIAVKRLQRYKKAPMEQGKTPVDSNKDNYHNTLPPTLGQGANDTKDGSTNDSERGSAYETPDYEAIWRNVSQPRSDDTRRRQ
ncbi:hypothetical protein NP493_137g02000 [Ridgeia piscesae]|uniref:Cyclic nucleotide-binding domain-containing protein n=1 Tax=Ridgeia piscesae TaxID=27915 RepID=A0AAD9P5B2_RIDPI|nr:hypothetical protein NP493_137g02000 [Ridgeia piscesae]